MMSMVLFISTAGQNSFYCLYTCIIVYRQPLASLYKQETKTQSQGNQELLEGAL